MRPAACFDVARAAAPQPAVSNSHRNNDVSPVDRAGAGCEPMVVHRDAISRYRRLLRPPLTDRERQVVRRRLAEERAALNDQVANEHSRPPGRGARASAPRLLNAARFASMIDDVERELGKP